MLGNVQSAHSYNCLQHTEGNVDGPRVLTAVQTKTNLAHMHTSCCRYCVSEENHSQHTDKVACQQVQEAIFLEAILVAQMTLAAVQAQAKLARTLGTVATTHHNDIYTRY